MVASAFIFNDFVNDVENNGDLANNRVEAVWIFSGWRWSGCMSMLFKVCPTLQSGHSMSPAARFGSRTRAIVYVRIMHDAR